MNRYNSTPEQTANAQASKTIPSAFEGFSPLLSVHPSHLHELINFFEDIISQALGIHELVVDT